MHERRPISVELLRELFMSYTVLGPLLISPEMVRGTAVPLKHITATMVGVCAETGPPTPRISVGRPSQKLTAS